MLNISDFKYAIRLLAKRPGFTVLTTLVMAAGIGLSVYLFSFLNTMAFKPLPFKDGESLIVLDRIQNGNKQNGGSVDLHDLYEIRTNVKGISEVGAYSQESVNIAGRDGARRYNAIAAEPNIFRITRTKPILGREFSEAENQTGAERVTVISYDFWQNHFGGDAEVLDQTLRINGVSNRVIGVMPEGYFFPRNTDLWLPMRQDATKLARGKGGNFSGMAHLDPGITMQDINAQLVVISKRLEQKYPETNKNIGAYVTTFPMSTIGNDADVFIYSMYMVAILLLVLASINVGNLLLSRAVERGQETAIRVALGAPRSRLIGQMLWESIIICTLGGTIGLLVAAWGLEVSESITATFTSDKPFFWWKFSVDAFTMKIFVFFVLSTILLTGLLPAWKNSGSDFNAVLRDGTRGALGKKAGRMNRILVISEVFLSITILIAAAVMVVGTYLATNADYGANTDNKMTAKIRLTQADYPTVEKRAQFAHTLQTQLENSVGIGAVTVTSAIPGQGEWQPTMAVEGIEYAKDQGYPRANYVVVTPGSLAKLGVELKQGRYFESVDNGLDKRTVIVSESFVSRHFKNESPLGKRIRIVATDGDEQNWLTVVGVVGHTIHGQSFGKRANSPGIFRPVTQAPRFNLSITMEMKSDATVVINTLRKTLESIDSDLPAYRIKTYKEVISRNSAGIGFISKIFFLFGMVAVVLASSGIYGVMSNTISQRTQEIGIKRALGADDNRITKEYLMNGFKQLCWGGIPGLLAGGGVGFAISQIMSTGNGVLIVITTLMISIIGSVVMLATYVPTKRALQLEPSDALHYQ